MTRIDGRNVNKHLILEADVVVIGSGPAGSAVARELAISGHDVLVVEAGHAFEESDFKESAFGAMAELYRDMSASVTLGAAPLPYIQGKMVGGSSPINGAICWRLPEDVYRSWLVEDPALSESLRWDEIEAVTDMIERRLNVRPTDPKIAGRKNLLMAQGADALGLEHRPIRRNVRDCEGLGRCLQGCPKSRKLSVDMTLLKDAEDAGARVLSSAEVLHIRVDDGIARRVIGQTLDSNGQPLGTFHADARHAVVVAASAIQTPVLLMKSGIKHGPVGHNFQCHPGVSMAGRFPEPVRMWEGATQGHEVIGLRRDGLKFETLGFGLGIMAGRMGGVGRQLAHEIEDMPHHLDWGAAVRAEAKGRVYNLRGRPIVRFSPTDRDVQKFRRGLRLMGEMMLAAGADYVLPGVRGVTERTSSVEELSRLETAGPRSSRAYKAAITHMFGTCQMGSDPQQNVVRPDFRHHRVDRLYVADSSVFPSNIGVNPQIPIMTFGTICAQNIHRAIQ